MAKKKKKSAKKATRKTARKTAKKASKKTAKSRSSAKRAKPKIKPRSGDKPRTKSEIFRELSENTGLARKEVVAIFDGLNELIEKDMAKRGPGVFTIPGLLKLQTVRKPATKARKGINPFTGEPTVFKAKPARTLVKARPLKALKDMV